MDIRNAKVEPTVEHGGTCHTYFMFPKESVRAETMGSYLEYVAEFELAGGAHLEPHTHDSDEFYYLLQGRAIVQVDDEQQLVDPGDLIHIPPNAPHSIWSADEAAPFRALSFAVSYMGEDATDIPAELPEPRVRVSVEEGK